MSLEIVDLIQQYHLYSTCVKAVIKTKQSLIFLISSIDPMYTPSPPPLPKCTPSPTHSALCPLTINVLKLSCAAQCFWACAFAGAWLT